MDGPKYDERGLVCAIAQDALSGDIRMVAWMNAEALAETQRTGLATFFSRSRQRLWTKGESSGNHLLVDSIHVDCDRDTVLLRVRAQGPSCHTGKPTCFFQELSPTGVGEAAQPAATFLSTLERELVARQQSTSAKSYTKSLLDKGVPAIGAKIREEANELVQALESESDERVVSEAADLLYHTMVGLRARDLPFQRVIEVLAARSGQSGHAEKAARQKPDGEG
jgi:phosphoribosyl-AMP cyclohydrolase / phosphoribosyl-ATP pyrophosphohydrolase